MSFVNAHFVTYFQDLGYHKLVAAGAFSLIGASAIIGALLLGHLSDQHGRRRLLSFSYNLRAIGFILVLLSMGIPFHGSQCPCAQQRRSRSGLHPSAAGADPPGE